MDTLITATLFSYPSLFCQSLLLVHLFRLTALLPYVLFLLLLFGGHESLQELFDYTGLNGDDALAKVFQALHVFHLWRELRAIKSVTLHSKIKHKNDKYNP